MTASEQRERFGRRRAQRAAAGEGGETQDAQVVNEASGHATIGVQGVVHGDVTIYEVAPGDLPDRKFEVAKNCLAGDMPRRAEKLIGELVEAGHVFDVPSSGLIPTEVAYYWTLAVLSDRPVDMLDAERFHDFDAACGIARRYPPDEWSQAQGITVRLVGCLLDRERTGTLDSADVETVFADYDRLPGERREEISLHLELILTGVIQDHIEDGSAELVRERRTGDDRENRVWKFFEPVPAEPRPMEVRTPDFAVLSRTMAVCGIVMGGAGILLSLVILGLESITSALLCGLLLVVGSVLAGRFGPDRFPRRYSPFPARRQVPEWTFFKAHVMRTVAREFGKHAPASTIQRSRWTMATHRRRTQLVNEFTNLYGDLDEERDGINWLIAWYAEEAADEWDGGRLDDPVNALPRIAVFLGLLLTGGTGLFVLYQVLAFQPRIANVTGMWILGSVLLLAGGRVDVRLVARLSRARAETESRRRLEAEQRAYRERCELLRDRPGDTEMVRWLDYDKRHLKSLAMNEYGLGNRDVLAHATLTEATRFARRARVRNGPPRFSAYKVWIFLLTATGVRQVTFHLDFPTGIAKDQTRRVFRYDAVTSARVVEAGYRFDDGHRKPILPPAEQHERLPESAVVLYQAFRLTLNNAEHVEIVLENLDARNLQPTGEVPDGAPPDVSGAGDLVGALRVLEAVAADGREWIAQAKQRHGRRLRNAAGVPPQNRSAGNGRPAGTGADGHPHWTPEGTGRS